MNDATTTVSAAASWQVCESPLWLAERRAIVWVDIERGLVFLADSATSWNSNDATKSETWNRVEPTAVFAPECGRIGAVVPCRSGHWVLVSDAGIVVFDPETQATRVVCHASFISDLRFNDAKSDPRGRLWCGTISLSRTRGAASLGRLDTLADGAHSITEIIPGLTNSNGLCWGRDGTPFYHIDTPTRAVVAYDVLEPIGNLQRRGEVVVFGDLPGRPDGMTIDTEGMLWIAHYAGGCVSRWNPQTGEVLERLALPHERVTSCTLGGDDFRTLFVTVADAGLFARRVNVAGNTADCYAD